MRSILLLAVVAMFAATADAQAFGRRGSRGGCGSSCGAATSYGSNTYGSNTYGIYPSQAPAIRENPAQPQVIEKPESNNMYNMLYIIDPITRQIRPATADEIKRIMDMPQKRDK